MSHLLACGARQGEESARLRLPTGSDMAGFGCWPPLAPHASSQGTSAPSWTRAQTPWLLPPMVLHTWGFSIGEAIAMH